MEKLRKIENLLRGSFLGLGVLLFAVYALFGGIENEAQSTPGGGGNSYVAYGTDTCAPGYDVAYTGVMHIAARRDFVSANAVAWAASDVLCSAITSESAGGFNTTIQSNHLSINLDHFRSLSTPADKYLCAVCVK